MTKKLSADVEMAILLPLDVLADKLKRIEEELRHLNLKVLNLATDRECGDLLDSIQRRAELMDETLHSIRSLVSELATRNDIPRASPDRYSGDGDADAVLEPGSSDHTPHKPPPEMDD